MSRYFIFQGKRATMDDPDLTKIMLDWSTIVLRYSFHDFTRFTHTTGQSWTQMNVLTHLYYRGPSEVMQLTDLMRVSPAGASQMVERLVQQGLVERVESKADRRVRLVHLTVQGQKVVEYSINSRQAWMEQLVSKLSDEEKKKVTQALMILNEKAALLEDPLKNMV
jgi:DNA-binding MarR family transcriptional regulator